MKECAWYIKNHGPTVKISSDKKIFIMDSVLNYQNKQYLVDSTDDIKDTSRVKHPAQVVVLDVVASDE